MRRQAGCCSVSTGEDGVHSLLNGFTSTASVALEVKVLRVSPSLDRGRGCESEEGQRDEHLGG